jgi:hypothetical protein
MVLIAKAPEELPVVVLPLVPLEKFALAKTAARAVALLVQEASVATTKICIGSSATKALTGWLLSAPDPGQCILHVGFPVVLETYLQP